MFILALKHDENGKDQTVMFSVDVPDYQSNVRKAVDAYQRYRMALRKTGDRSLTNPVAVYFAHTYQNAGLSMAWGAYRMRDILTSRVVRTVANSLVENGQVTLID